MKSEVNGINFKPRKWLVIILIIIAIAISVALINKAITIYKEKAGDFSSSGIFNLFNNDEFNSDFFNSEFEFYTGTQEKFLTNSLLDKIITNNKKNSDHLLTVIFKEHNTTNPEEITNIKSELNDNSQYEIAIDYDKKNYANKVTIIEKENTVKKESEKKSFNSNYEFYTGTQHKGVISSFILDKVITNNKTNQEHLITVVFKNYNTTSPEEIKNLKSELDDWKSYEVSLDYNDEGYVYKIIIE